MTLNNDIKELSVTRHIDAKPEEIWQVMTERLTEWWCPKPWTTEIIDVDWRAGGRFTVTMRGPDGEEAPIEGVFLEVTPNRRMVFTDAIDADWNPQEPFMIGFLELEPEGDGTRYTGRARHWTDEARKQHQEMGFEGGWGIVADQLAALAEAK